MIYTSHDSSLPGAMFEITGDLALRQKWPLGNHGVDTRYSVRMLFRDTFYCRSAGYILVLDTHLMTFLQDNLSKWAPER